MKKLKWYYKHGTKYELFSVLYEDCTFMLVQNDSTKNFSFGVCRDFGTLYGFPINQSCLTIEECKKQLTAFIRIDKSYINSLGEIAEKNIERWQNMIRALKTTEED